MTTLVRGSWELTYTFNEIRGDVGAVVANLIIMLLKKIYLVTIPVSTSIVN